MRTILTASVLAALTVLLLWSLRGLGQGAGLAVPKSVVAEDQPQTTEILEEVLDGRQITSRTRVSTSPPPASAIANRGDPEKQEAFKMHAGLIGQDEAGLSFHDRSYKLAMTDALKSMSATIQTRATSIAGFSSEALLAKALQEDKSGRVAEVYDLSLDAAESIFETARAEWERRTYIEQWDASIGERDVAGWLADRSEVRTGAYRFTNSIRVGDTAYCLHYSTNLHPAVEAKIDLIEAKKRIIIASK